MKVIYASSADRGLDRLLDIWPAIKKEFPEAELVWAYGWNIFDKFHAKNPEMMKWKWQVIRKMHEVGCKSLGRLSHEELAREMKTCDIWAYPTYFPEIHCITALKAQAAELDVVTSGFAALQETVYKDEPYIDIKTTKGQTEFTQYLLDTMRNPTPKKERQTLAKRVLKDNDWSEVAEGWDKVIKEVKNAVRVS